MTGRRLGIFVALIAASFAAAAPVLRQLWEYSRADESSSHLVLIPVVSVALVWMRRDEIFAHVRTCWFGLVVIGVSTAGLAAWAAGVTPGSSGLLWSVLALVGVWVGAFVLAFGRVATQAAAFPLFFLAFTVPIPDVVLAGLISVLKIGSAWAVGVLFSFTGTPFFRSDFVFELPGVAIEIADECSGIRSTIALALTSLLAGHQFLDRPWKTALLIVSVLPITIVKNAVRIVSLSLLAVYVDPGFLVGQLHHDGGVIFFFFALALLYPILSLLRRSGSAPWKQPPTLVPSSLRRNLPNG